MEITAEEFVIMFSNRGIRVCDSNDNMIHYIDSDEYEWSKEYDQTHNCIHFKDSNGFEYWYNSDGDSITKNTYDKIHKMSVTNTKAYVTVENSIITVLDSTNMAIYFKVISASEICLNCDITENKIHLKDSDDYEDWREYDSNRNLIYFKDSTGYEEWKEYDVHNNEIHSRNSDGYEEWSEYDGNNNMIHYNDSDDYEQWEEYGSNNNMLRYKDSTGYEAWYNSDGDKITQDAYDRHKYLTSCMLMGMM